MRNELEQMEQIEQYLLGKMNATEKEAFERQLQGDAGLRAQVGRQRLLTEAVKMQAVKQSISNSAKKYFFKKNLFKWGLGGSALAATGLIVLLATGNNPFTSKQDNPWHLPELNENNEKVWADADKYLPAQVFHIDNNKDTLLQTKSGILFVVPANCFLDKNGNPVKRNVDLNVKEAINADDIIKAGMDTRSNGELLESGGMFYLNPTQDGENVKIDPSKGIYTEIPVDKNKEGMLLYEGERKPDGSINWINPRLPEKFLTTVDITTLDFYPRGYLDKLQEMDYNTRDKQFTDSLYYSFAKYFNLLPYNGLDSVRVAESSSIIQSSYYDTLKEKIVVKKDTSTVYYYEKIVNDTTPGKPLGINPAKIKAIWNDEFQGTLLATKEFEFRLKGILQTCDARILDLYVNNLDKKMCTIDSMVANLGGDRSHEWLWLAARGDGRVKSSLPHLKKLQEYYDRVAKAETEAIQKTVEKFQQEQQAKDREAGNKQFQHTVEDQKRTAENMMREFTVNLDEACRQLGIKKGGTVPDNPFGTTITASGWYNVDRAVMESTLARTTLDYTDPNSGKKAEIKYLPFTFTTARKDFDRITVYLLPDSLYSFMRVKREGNEFKENLNELMKYDLVAIGYQGEKVFYFESNDVDPGTLAANWSAVGAEDLDKKLAGLRSPNISQQVMNDVKFEQYMVMDEERRQQNLKRNELEARIKPKVLPCWHDETVSKGDMIRTSHARK